MGRAKYYTEKGSVQKLFLRFINFSPLESEEGDAPSKTLLTLDTIEKMHCLRFALEFCLKVESVHIAQRQFGR